MSDARPLGLFEAFGVELEYMIVDRDSLAVRPIADQLLADAAGHVTSDVEYADISWSNELALHLVELKTSVPAASLVPAPAAFQDHVRRINEHLARHNAQLMPGGMHPFMDPGRELALWPHDYREVYEAFDRVFDCRRHGWANLQSVHLNLPFASDEEFARLHAAVRVLLPILPALAASSPIVEGRPTGFIDTRLEVYRGNAVRIPSIAGRVIPEPVFDPSEYRETILERMYADIRPYDPDGLLQYEYLNARGAIARFDRGAIEIRVLDVQERPAADVANCALAVEVLRMLVAEEWCDLAQQQAWGVEPLLTILLATARDAEEASITDPDYLALFGCRDWQRASAEQLWQRLLERAASRSADFARHWSAALETNLAHGSLGRRIVRRLDGDYARAKLETVYRELCDCLASGAMFGATGAEHSRSMPGVTAQD